MSKAEVKNFEALASSRKHQTEELKRLYHQTKMMQGKLDPAVDKQGKEEGSDCGRPKTQQTAHNQTTQNSGTWRKALDQRSPTELSLKHQRPTTQRQRGTLARAESFREEHQKHNLSARKSSG